MSARNAKARTVVMSLARLVAASGVLMVLGSAPGLAQSCTFTFTNITFTDVDVTANANVDITGTFTATCSGARDRTVRVCPHLGPGTGGSGPNGDPRRMLSGANVLNMNLYKDAQRQQVWGSSLVWPGTTPPPIDVAITRSNRNFTATQTVYARIPAGQGTAAVSPVGTPYRSAFSGADVRVRYDYTTAPGAGSCATLTGIEGSAAFAVQANVIPRCTVGATPLNFGSAGILAVQRDAQSMLSVNCTTGAPYQIGLGPGNGQGAGVDPLARRMRLGGLSTTSTIIYALFRNAARDQPWGNTLGTGGNAAGGTGTGGTFNHPVYGRVPGGQNPSVGSYSDTVVITITY